MKKSGKFILLAVTLAVLVLLAVFGYDYLTDRYNVPGQSENDIGLAAEQSGSNSVLAPEQKNSAADFTVTDTDGNSVKLSDYFGKPIIINFWATWCGPCKSELPAFDKVYKKHGGDITFMMINLTDGYRDTIDRVNDFVSENGYDFPVYFDTQYNGSDAYNVSSIPLTIMIDKNGNVYKSHVGAMSESTLQGYINALTRGGGE